MLEESKVYCIDKTDVYSRREIPTQHGRPCRALSECYVRAVRAFGQSCLPRHASNPFGEHDPTLILLSGEVTEASKWDK